MERGERGTGKQEHLYILLCSCTVTLVIIITVILMGVNAVNGNSNDSMINNSKWIMMIMRSVVADPGPSVLESEIPAE